MTTTTKRKRNRKCSRPATPTALARQPDNRHSPDRNLPSRDHPPFTSRGDVKGHGAVASTTDAISITDPAASPPARALPGERPDNPLSIAAELDLAFGPISDKNVHLWEHRTYLLLIGIIHQRLAAGEADLEIQDLIALAKALAENRRVQARAAPAMDQAAPTSPASVNHQGSPSSSNDGPSSSDDQDPPANDTRTSPGIADPADDPPTAPNDLPAPIADAIRNVYGLSPSEISNLKLEIAKVHAATVPRTVAVPALPSLRPNGP
jgi:hypothetical protein